MRPRFSTHHLASATLTTRFPIIAAPTVNASDRRMSHCVSGEISLPRKVISLMALVRNIDTPTIVTPTTINGRPPHLSIHPPIMNPTRPIVIRDPVCPSKNCDRSQPNSELIESSIVLVTPFCVPMATSCAKNAAIVIQ